MRRSFEFEPFVARPPWWGRHLQSMRNAFVPRLLIRSLPRGERLKLDMADGSGDRLAARLNAPLTTSPQDTLVVLVHGLGGCEDSLYMIAATRFFLERGNFVLRLNLRGYGPSRHSCLDFAHAGRTGDLRAALADLPARFDATPILLVGFSLGGNTLLKFLGEGDVDTRVTAAASVSAPLDLRAASDLIHQRHNRIYHDYLLRAVKRGYLHTNSPIPKVTADAIRRAATLKAVDDIYTGPHHGYADAHDYYTRVSCLPYLDGITVPTLAVHAADDPFVPCAPYRAYDWQGHTHAHGLVSRGGGHVGFHDIKGLWHLRQISRFFDVVISADGRAASAQAA
ncbi:MAG: YheT family hydrolase [Geminicoccaceae bacterium]